MEPVIFGGWSDLVVGQNANGTLEQVGIGSDHTTWVKKQTSPSGLAFDAFWTSLGGYVNQLAPRTNQDLALASAAITPPTTFRKTASRA